MALLAVPILVWACRVGLPRFHSVVPHHAFIAPVELLPVAHVVHRAGQAVGAMLDSDRSQLPDRILPSFAEGSPDSRNSRSFPSPNLSTSARSGTPGARKFARRG